MTKVIATKKDPSLKQTKFKSSNDISFTQNNTIMNCNKYEPSKAWTGIASSRFETALQRRAAT